MTVGQHYLAKFAKRYVMTGAHGVFDLTLGLFTWSGRQRLKSLAAVYDIDRPPCQLPTITVDALTPDATKVEVHQLARHRYNVDNLELLAINRVVAHFRPQRIFEFGTFDGRTTINMAANAAETTEIVTLDLPPDEKQFPDGSTLGSRWETHPVRARLRQVYGNSLRLDFTPYEGLFDLVFIDAGHSYECVMNDSQVARRLLRSSGGIILWHDYSTLDDVNRAINELYNAGDVWQDMRHLRGTSLACLVTGEAISNMAAPPAAWGSIQAG